MILKGQIKIVIGSRISKDLFDNKFGGNSSGFHNKMIEVQNNRVKYKELNCIYCQEGYKTVNIMVLSDEQLINSNIETK